MDNKNTNNKNINNQINQKNIKRQNVNNKNNYQKTQRANNKNVNLRDRNNISRQMQKKKKELSLRNLKKGIYKRVDYSLRLNILLVVFALLFLALIGKLVSVVVFDGKDLTKKATDQQLVSKVINPARGAILDRNGEILAQSVPVDTVSINPKIFRKQIGDEKNKVDVEDFIINTASILEINAGEIREKINSQKQIETLAKYINVDKVKKYKKYLEDKKIINLVNFDQDTKRVYPYGTLASQLIGFCGTDNTGLEGLERSYNDVLSGRPGKIMSIGDGTNSFTPEFQERIVKEENGKNIYLTLDIKMQNVVEKYLKETVEASKADSGVVVAMNPKNGQILTMANYPTFDLTKPFAPIDMSQDEWDKLDTKERNARLQDRWKNKSVSDPYEPGSVFKLVTAAIGLEIDVTKAKIPGDFYCSGYQQVQDRKIHCSYEKGHGAESLHEAIMHSCNPAMIQLGKRIGKENFVKYMRAYGFFNRTGADISGESVGQFFQNDHFNDVELATLSFGQRFTINPLQMLNAVSAIVNGGQLYKPSIINKIANDTKGTAEYIKPEIVRKVLSETHSKEIREMMRAVVETGTGIRGKVNGYSTGGKTGTSEPSPGNKEAGYVASYVAAAPIEEPEIVILAIIKNPKKGSFEGSVVAAPLTAKILSEVLPSLQKTNLLDLKETKISNKDEIKKIKVPNVEGKTIFEARKILQREGLTPEIGNYSNMNEVTIDSQMPKSDEVVSEAGIVFLKTKENTFDMVKVPDLKDKSLEAAIEDLKNTKLNFLLEGKGTKVSSQSIPKDTEVEKGRVIVLNLE